LIGIYGSSVAGGAPIRLADSSVSPLLIPQGETVPFSEINSNASPALNDVGDVLFVGGVGGNIFTVSRGLFTVPVTGGQATRLARQSRPAPLLADGAARSYFSIYGDYDINDARQYIFQHSFAAGAGTVNAVFSGTLGTTVSLSEPPGIANYVVLDSIAPPLGDAVPGRLGGKFTDLLAGAMNDAGQIALPANDNGFVNGQGVYSADLSGSGLSLVAHNPDVPPGRVAPSAFTSFQSRNAAINELGNMALAPNGTTGAPLNDLVFGLYFYEECSGKLERILDRDTVAPPLPVGLGKTFGLPGCAGSPCERDVQVWQGFETRAGYYRSINDLDDVAFLAAFSTFDVGVYVAHVETSGGVVTIQCPPTATVECPANPLPALTGVPITTGCGTVTTTFVDSAPTPTCGNAYTLTRTWTASNGSSSATCQQLIHVVDTTAPDLSIPVNAAIQCNQSSDPSNTGVASATDACGPTPSVAYSDTVAPGACPNQYVITRTWTATDACGNFASGVQTISVGDNNLAVITVPANVTIACSESSAPSNTGTATAIDACDANPTVTYSDSTMPGTCANESTITRTWTATDACGNVSTGTQVITIVDDIGPVIALPVNATAECNTSIHPSVTGYASATDACDGAALAVTYTDASMTVGSCFGETIVTREWTATDACGNTSTASQIITIRDTIAPVIQTPPAITVQCNDPTHPSFTGQAGGSDACDFAPVIGYADSVVAGSCPQSYVISRTWSITDSCGNSTSQVQLITVQDTLAPALFVPADITIACGDSADTSLTGSASAADACDPAPMVTFLDASAPGQCPEISVITRTWTATDACGNASTGTQRIALIDEDPPLITCPSNVSATTPPGSCAIGNLDIGFAVATDLCSEVTVTNNAPASFPVGTTVVTWTATDACGLSATCQQQVTVEDSSPPAICLYLCNTMLWPPNHDFVPVGLSAAAFDRCDGPLPVSILVYSDEDDETPTGDGVHSPDAKNIAPGTLRLRRERIGGGNGRVYLIVASAQDSSGNRRTSCGTVVVPASRNLWDLHNVMMQAVAARAYCHMTGNPPPGYVLVGDGAVIGPKQ
jgi:HYR domain